MPGMIEGNPTAEATWINEYDVKKDLFKVWTHELKSLKRDIKLCSWPDKEKELAIELLPSAEMAAKLNPSAIHATQTLVEMSTPIWIMSQFNFSRQENFSLRVATNYGQEEVEKPQTSLESFWDNLKSKMRGDKRLSLEQAE